MKRKILIPTILGLALTGTGVPSAQASPSAAVARPAPTPDNTQQSTANIGTITCSPAQMSYVIKGRNLKGTSAWYSFGAACGTSASTTKLVAFSISGGTGDTMTLTNATTGMLIARNSVGLTTLELITGYEYYLDVSGGTKGAQFTLTITPTSTGG